MGTPSYLSSPKGTPRAHCYHHSTNESTSQYGNLSFSLMCSSYSYIGTRVNVNEILSVNYLLLIGVLVLFFVLVLLHSNPHLLHLNGFVFGP